MGCCGSKCCDLVEDDSGLFTPMRKRWCTDIVCLALWLLTAAGLITIAVFSLNNGSINYLLFPTDYLGQFCGHTDGVKTRTKAFYPRLDQDLKNQLSLILSPTGFVNFQPYTLCLEECPQVFSLENPEAYGGPSYPGVKNASAAPTFYASFTTREVFNRCLPTTQSIPSTQRELCTVPNCTDPSLAAAFNASGLGPLTCTDIPSQPSVTSAWVLTEPTRDLCDFPVTEVNTQSFLPEGATAQTKGLERDFATFLTNSFAVLRSITNSWKQVLLCGVAGPFVFAALWFVFLFLFAGFIIFFAITLLLLFLIALTVYMYVKAGWASSLLSPFQNFTAVETIFEPSFETGLSQSWYAVFAVALTIFTFIAFILVFVWRKTIGRTIAIVREVTKIFYAIPLMVVYPLVAVFFGAGVVAYGIVIGCFIITQGHSTFDEIDTFVERRASGTLVSGTVDNIFGEFTDLSKEVQIGILLAVHVVGCVWAYYITQNAQYATLARVSAMWFFSHEAGSDGKVRLRKGFGCGLRALLSSAWCILWRHLGSVAFGAAIMTICKVLQWVLNGIDYHTKELQGTNFMLRLVIRCSQCCLWCLEKTVKFITYYGLIFVAIEGKSFCKACQKTMGFWIKYPTQTAVNEGVQWLLSACISLSIPTGAALVGFIWIDAIKGHQPIWAALAIWVLAYVIAASITDVFKCAIDTIFICAFQDMEEHSPPRYMSEALKDGFGLRDIERLSAVRGSQANSERGAITDPRGASVSVTHLGGGGGRGPSVSGQTDKPRGRGFSLARPSNRAQQQSRAQSIEMRQEPLNGRM